MLLKIQPIHYNTNIYININVKLDFIKTSLLLDERSAGEVEISAAVLFHGVSVTTAQADTSHCSDT